MERLPGSRLLLYGCAAAVVLAVLAPLARAGYVLRYDMVFVPRQPLSWDLFVPSGALPRAVPQDALVSLSALIMPGWLAQRIALAGLLAAAAIGAGRLVPARRDLTRVVAAIGYAWTPFLAERLLIGQWGLLVCYAAMPWLVRAARDVRLGRPGAGARVVLAAACAAITPTGGLIALATTLALARPPGRSETAQPTRTAEPTGTAERTGTAGLRWRGRGLGLVLAVVALNAPWLVAAAIATSPLVSDSRAVAAFAARAENWGGALVALAGTGGIWNADAVPGSRAAPLVPLITIGLLAAAAFGFGRLRQRWPDGTATRLAWLAGGGLLLGAAGALPGTSDVLRTAVDLLPGAGLFRDGQKFLIPYALGLVLCISLGVERIAARLPGGRLVLVGFALLPVVTLPDLAWGAGGKLRPVAYPAEWAAVAKTVAAEPGPVLSLPMSAYRVYSWNPGAAVYDPAGRYLASPVVADDRLAVDLRPEALVIRGESEAAAAVRERLAAGGPAADSTIRWVLVQGGNQPAGLTEVYRGTELTLYRNPGYRAQERNPSTGLAGYLLAGSVVAVAGWRRATTRRRQR
ncbi:hypothetical protein BJ973_000839 [Actinoplanes tereljensis]|nr:hypothetical protein [Actinoplanes tereljensis]